MLWVWTDSGSCMGTFTSFPMHASVSKTGVPDYSALEDMVYEEYTLWENTS